MFANALLALTLTATPGAPPEAPDVRENVKKGLEWLAGRQAQDGSWSGNNGMYPTAITGFAGLALLMEGSTLREGPYCDHVRRAVGWFEKSAQPSGLLVPPGNPDERSRYILGHGIGLTFLAAAYDVDDDEPRRKRLARLLEGAVKFAAESQTSRGGWGYVSAKDGNDFDEANSAVTMLQALLAAEKAGVKVPKAVLDRAVKYLVDSTNREGGVIYSLSNGMRPMGGDGRPTMSAGAAAAVLMAEGRRPETLARWVGYAYRNLPPVEGTNVVDSVAVYQHYHLARVANVLGETGHRKLDPAAKDVDLLLWSAYRAALFKTLKAAQAADGSWADQLGVGPAFGTALALIVLQLDNNYLPAFSK